MTLADRLVVLNGGQIEQVGTPIEVYERPASLFVASFIGSPAMNLIDVEQTDGGVTVGGSHVPVERGVLAGSTGKRVTLGVRPEDLDVVSEGEGIPVEIDVVEELGADAYIYGRQPGTEVSDDKPFIARVDGRTPPTKGEIVHFLPKSDHLHVFDAQSGQRLGA